MFAKFTPIYLIACFAALAFALPVLVAVPEAVALANTEILALQKLLLNGKPCLLEHEAHMSAFEELDRALKPETTMEWRAEVKHWEENPNDLR
ncbi:hypothetical protein DFH29DRAFT_1004829 [Suillus ampliporus]|nr:hypothetical protein DFH29DRAFT_1004829 [Suillus ampliporus]